MDHQYVTCNQCGWVHFALPAVRVLANVDEFNTWYDCQPDEVQAHYGGHASIQDYTQCAFCGGSHRNFRDSLPGDCPDGCTIGPILHYSEPTIAESKEN